MVDAVGQQGLVVQFMDFMVHHGFAVVSIGWSVGNGIGWCVRYRVSWGRMVVCHGWGMVGDRGMGNGDGWCVGNVNCCWGMGNGNGFHDGWFSGLADDGVESIDGISRVVHGAASAIGFNQGVLQEIDNKVSRS